MPTKAISIRLDKGLADEIAAIARVSDVSVSEAIREAISEHIAERRTNPEFQKRLKDRVEADRQMFEHLAG
jgi:predicted transcriptional regulator